MRKMRWLWGVAFCACSGDFEEALVNQGFEIDCGDRPCDWQVIEGNATFAPGWHPADAAVHLAPGRVVLEQRGAGFYLRQRDLVVRGVAYGEPGNQLRVELDWTCPEAAAPRWVDVDVDHEGGFERVTAAPSLECDEIRLRVIKEGPDTVLLDELFVEYREDLHAD